MTTDGGGWTLILNYLHQSNTNPNLTVMDRSLPLPSTQNFGQNGPTQPISWGHADNDLLKALAFNEVRFHGKASGATILANGYYETWTQLENHASDLPWAARQWCRDKGGSAPTECTFYLDANNGWNIRGEGSKRQVGWQSTGHTHHQIWVR